MSENIESHSYDILIIGSGGAGLRAAIAAAEGGAKVAVLGKSLLGKAHTVMAEGGVAASLGNVDPDDGWETHFYDTMRSGHFINNYKTAEVFSKEAPQRVLELEQWGAVFDRTPEGKIMQRPFGAHTFRRLAHVGDRTGMELIRTLEQKILTTNVDVFQEITATKLFLDNGRIAGAVAYYREDGRFALFAAKAVVIATGGWGKLFKVTSNSWESTGDGAALAFRAGAELIDMEMVQFHPTGMVWPPGVRGILVTEGVRGEGGLLRNSEGERFMEKYDPQRMELSSRDVVARGIYKEAQAGRGTPHGGAWLDITHRGPEYIKRKLPGMYQQFMALADVDITKTPFEVGPTIHYTMGGLKVDAYSCATNVPGLFAAGECAAGLHGANRLGGNSLSDILVFGKRAGDGALEFIQGNEGMPRIDEGEVQAEIQRVLAPVGKEDGENPYAIHERLQEIMADHAGISRTGSDLEKGLELILELKERSRNMVAPGSRAFNPGWHTVQDVSNMITLSEAIVRGAIERKESRGAQWRLDFPDELEEFGKVNFVHKLEDGEVKTYTSPVPEMPKELQELFELGAAPGVAKSGKKE